MNFSGISGNAQHLKHEKISESWKVGKILREGKYLLIARHVPGTVLSALLAYVIPTAAL